MIENHLDLLCFGESKLDNSYPTGQFSISGYSSPYRLDVSKSSGGLLIYVNENIASRQLTDYKFCGDIQALPIELNFLKSKWLFLPIYRPPRTNLSDFINEISNIIDFYSNKYQNILIGGDFNVEVSDKTLETFMNKYELFSLIKAPTCFKGTNGRCIDLFLTNKKQSFMHNNTFETGFSDFHSMIYTMFKMRYTKLPPIITRYRCYKNYNANIFYRELNENINNIVYKNFNTFEAIFRQTLDKHAPIKTKIKRGNNKPFVNKVLSKAISTRSRLRKIANKFGDINDISAYKKQRNLVKNLTLKTKRDYYKKLDPYNPKLSKSFYKTFKPLFSSKYVPPNKLLLIENDRIITDDKVLADKMNNYFSNITNSLNIFHWPEPFNGENNAIAHAVFKYKDHPSVLKIKSMNTGAKKFEFNQILPETVYQNVKKLDQSKSTRGDIPIKIIKETIDFIGIPLTDCLNTSISEGNFPTEMKFADIIPIFKKLQRFNKKNYRPISLLSSYSKVFERILDEQINIFMKDKFSPNLCGFRKGYSSEDALIQLLEDWRTKLDGKKIVGAIVCDLSKAFDTLPHDLIIAKLDAYGFGPDALKLMSSYLNERMQRCKVGSEYSNWVNILVGVPQGSVLGPLLFSIFIIDFLFSIPDSNLCNFADDETLYSSGDNLDIVINKLEHDLIKTLQWFKVNSLVANPEKFQFMILGANHKVNLCLEINGKRILSKTEIVLLGVTIDSKLNLNKHVEAICKSANIKINALMRLRSMLSEDQKLVLYNSFIMSQFNYCSNVWMFHGKVANDKINRVQKRALRAVYNDFTSNYLDL